MLHVIIINATGGKHLADMWFFILETSVKATSVCVANGALAASFVALEISPKCFSISEMNYSILIVLNAVLEFADVYLSVADSLTFAVSRPIFYLTRVHPLLTT